MERIKAIGDWVRERMASESTGHDYHHVVRVSSNALRLAEAESPCDLEIISTAALLHDIPDRKLHPDPAQGFREISSLMDSLGYSAASRDHVLEIIEGVSYRGAGVETPMRTLEGRIVQDADRLDALGAIGIARCFAYGGKKHRPIYDPAQAPELHSEAEAYHSAEGSSLNHFYEKLLLLRDRMQTESGKKAAAERHRFLEEYLARFLKEWDGADFQ